MIKSLEKQLDDLFTSWNLSELENGGVILSKIMDGESVECIYAACPSKLVYVTKEGVYEATFNDDKSSIETTKSFWEVLKKEENIDVFVGVIQKGGLWDKQALWSSIPTMDLTNDN